MLQATVYVSIEYHREQSTAWKPTSQLHFPTATARDDLLFLDSRTQRRTVRQTAQGAQDLRNSVIGKHGNFVNVIETTITLTLETSPKVGN